MGTFTSTWELPLVDWTIDGKVMFTIYNYLEDILAEAPLEFDREDVTSAIIELFQLKVTCRKLNMATADLFHRIVARFLYVAKRARPDVQVAVVFL